MANENMDSKLKLQKNIRTRFASLGVQLGAEGIAPKKKQHDFLIENVVNGGFEENQFGSFFYTETKYSVGKEYGNQTLEIISMPESIQRTLTPTQTESNPSDFIFIDTETSGLSGGVGTWAFMVGVVRQLEDEFVAKQFFMRNPSEERAMLYGFEQFIEDAKVIVSFNGKSFDVPMLRTRFQMQRMTSDLFQMAHYDLLHISRRLWRYNLDDRRLGNLEVLKLGVHRSHDDVPGFIIPTLYREYLKSGDARPLKSIFYHNLVDIVSLVTLTKLLNQNFDFAQPLDRPAAEWFGLAKHAEAVEMIPEAIDAYLNALYNGLEPELEKKANYNLASIYKHHKQWEKAIEVWDPMAQAGDIEACVELAKAFEHRNQEFSDFVKNENSLASLEDKKKTVAFALQWTQLAIDYVFESSLMSSFYLSDLNHRKYRIDDKIQRLEEKIEKEKLNETNK